MSLDLTRRIRVKCARSQGDRRRFISVAFFPAQLADVRCAKRVYNVTITCSASERIILSVLNLAGVSVY